MASKRSNSTTKGCKAIHRLENHAQFSRSRPNSHGCTPYNVWKLSRYARFIYNSADRNELHGTWKFYENNDGKIDLHLKEEQLIVTQDDLILESYCLRTASETIRILTKTDSALIFCRINNECRRFRLQFDSTSDLTSSQNCADFLTAIRPFVNFRNIDTYSGGGNTADSGEQKVNKENLEGETPLSAIVKALKKPHETNLPLAYRHAHVTDEELPTLVRMFLSDANFPAFVEQVEKELNAIMQ